MFYVGIDYSMSSPGICIWNDSLPLTFSSCKFYFFHDKPEKYNHLLENVTALPKVESTSDMERFDHLASAILNVLPGTAQTTITIEGYSMGSTGRVFQIAENCAVLKHTLWRRGYTFDQTIAPSAIKKFATTKGNAKKPDMYEAFLQAGNPDIHSILSPKKKIETSFVADLVDAYWIMRYAIPK